MTRSSFAEMNEQEQRDLARRLAEGSEVLDFERALRIVEFKPAKAERLIREREESKKLMEELNRAVERLHRTVRERG
jgi:type II secretory pathway component PulF